MTLNQKKKKKKEKESLIDLFFFFGSVNRHLNGSFGIFLKKIICEILIN